MRKHHPFPTLAGAEADAEVLGPRPPEDLVRRGSRVDDAAVERPDVQPGDAASHRGDDGRVAPGQHKGAKFSTFKAHISVSFYSFRLIFGRVIISPQVLVGCMLFLTRSIAKNSS